LRLRSSTIKSRAADFLGWSRGPGLGAAKNTGSNSRRKGDESPTRLQILDREIHINIPANTQMEDALIDWGKKAGDSVMMDTIDERDSLVFPSKKMRLIVSLS
jgi:hypothetical protein